MKNISDKLIKIFHEGFCGPLITKISKEIKEPMTTIHYNIKKMEETGIIKGYKAIFNYKKLNKNYCTYVMLNLNSENYANPERIGKELSKFNEIESIDIVTGDFEMILKIRTKDSDEYYELMKKIVQKFKIEKSISYSSLKQIKSEFIVE